MLPRHLNSPTAASMLTLGPIAAIGLVILCGLGLVLAIAVPLLMGYGLIVRGRQLLRWLKRR